MNELLSASSYWGVTATLAAYWLAIKISRKFRHTLCNPLLIASLLMISILLIFNIDYTVYKNSNQYLNYLLTPATICLALPMYHQLEILKKQFAAISISIISGCLACGVVIFFLSRLLGFSNEVYVSLAPKSVTTAIALGISTELGGNSSITAVMVVITGVLGAVIAQTFLKFLKISNPVAQGLAIGNSAHVVGTSKALELGEVQGAMSSLAIAVAGVLTVILAPCLSSLY